MSWLLPGFLVGGLMVALPIALHFLRSKPKVIVPFPSLRFLGATAIRDTKSHRLRRWITLALRCLIIAGLAAAFSRPFWADKAAATRKAMVIAVDNSMSMQAPGRWEDRREWALQQLSELEHGDRAGLLAMQPRPTWMVPLTDDLAQVRAVLMGLEAGYETTAYGPALQVAGESLAAVPAAERILVWMADEQRLGWMGVSFPDALPAGITVRMSETAPPVSRQAAIVKVQRNGTEELSVTIRQFVPASDTRSLSLLQAGKELSRQTVSLQTGENIVKVSLKNLPATDGWRVELDADEFPPDDIAWATGGAEDANVIMIDTVPETDFLQHAIDSSHILPTGGLGTMSIPDTNWPVEKPVIIRTTELFREPAVAELDRFINAGGAAWIVVNGSPEQITWLEKRGIHVSKRNELDGPWNLRNWDPSHPILAAYVGQSLLPLLNINFHQGYSLEGDGLLPLADWPDGKTAIAEYSSNGRRVLIAGFSMDRTATDWPSQPSFLPFVHQTMRWLGSFANTRNDWRVGEVIPLPSEQGIWRTLDATHPQRDRPAGGSIRATIPGLYEFTEGPLKKRYAVNIRPEESNLEPWPRPEELLTLEKSTTNPGSRAVQGGIPLSAEVAESRQRLWWWILAICGLALLGELALANRTAM